MVLGTLVVIEFFVTGFIVSYLTTFATRGKIVWSLFSIALAMIFMHLLVSNIFSIYDQPLTADALLDYFFLFSAGLLLDIGSIALFLKKDIWTESSKTDEAASRKMLPSEEDAMRMEKEMSDMDKQ